MTQKKACRVNLQKSLSPPAALSAAVHVPLAHQMQTVLEEETF